VGALAPLPLLFWVWGMISFDASVWVCLHLSRSSFGLGDYLSCGWCVGVLAPLPLLFWIGGIIYFDAGVWVCLHSSHSSFGLGDYLFWVSVMILHLLGNF